MPTTDFRSFARTTALAAALLVGASACSSETEPSVPSPTEVGPLTLSSPDLGADGRLPEWATATVMSFCAGENRSPRLTWKGVPESTSGFALTLVDATEPEYVHWVVTGIDPEVRAIDSAPDGGIDEGVAGWNFLSPGAYRGPCVEDHTYQFTLYALDAEITGDARTTREDLLAMIEGHVLDSATLDVRPATD